MTPLVHFLTLRTYFRATWVQAEKRGNIFGKSWRDSSGNRLQEILWYEDMNAEGQDEPTAGDVFGYIENDSVWGASEAAQQAYYCVYSIDYLCDIAEEPEEVS